MDRTSLLQLFPFKLSAALALWKHGHTRAFFPVDKYDVVALQENSVERMTSRGYLWSRRDTEQMGVMGNKARSLIYRLGATQGGWALSMERHHFPVGMNVTREPGPFPEGQWV